jgi:hypothetical protein
VFDVRNGPAKPNMLPIALCGGFAMWVMEAIVRHII